MSTKRLAENAGVVVENFERKHTEARTALAAKRATFDAIAARAALDGEDADGVQEAGAWIEVQACEREVARYEAALGEAVRRHAEAVEHDRAADADDLWAELERVRDETEPALAEVASLAEQLGEASKRYLALVEQLAAGCPTEEASARLSGGAIRRVTSARNNLSYIVCHFLSDTHESFQLPAVGWGLGGTLRAEHDANTALGTRVLTPPAQEPEPTPKGAIRSLLDYVAGRAA